MLSASALGIREACRLEVEVVGDTIVLKWKITLLDDSVLP